MFELFKGQNIIKFNDTFSTSEKCKVYLENYKWKNGFDCSKCHGTTNWKGIKPYTKVCKSCRHVESVTANTLFHKVKFDLAKAFMIAFEMSTSSKGSSSVNLSKRYGINQKTAWKFMAKVRKAMTSSKAYSLDGECEVDECFIGGYEEGKVGRGADSKKQVAIAIEKTGKYGIKRAYAVHIKNASSKELGKVFDNHISKEANIKTDKWKGYAPLQKEYKIVQEKSEPKKNFKVMHRFIQGLKSWVRGIYHHVSKAYLQNYLNEYCYRFNRHAFKETIFDNLIQRMMKPNTVFVKAL